MVVETLGDAFAAGWRITARCACGKREGMKSRRECQYTRELEPRNAGLDLRAELPAVELGWTADVPALSVTARGGGVPAADAIEVSKRIARADGARLTDGGCHLWPKRYEI